jgi:RNA polymerase primary sigma factor
MSDCTLRSSSTYGGVPTSINRRTFLKIWIAATLASSSTWTDAFTPQQQPQHLQQQQQQHQQQPKKDDVSINNRSVNKKNHYTLPIVGLQKSSSSSLSSPSSIIFNPEHVSFDQLRQLEAVYKINVVSPSTIDNNKNVAVARKTKSSAAIAAVAAVSTQIGALRSIPGNMFKVIPLVASSSSSSSGKSNGNDITKRSVKKMHRPVSQYCRVEAAAAVQQKQQQQEATLQANRLRSVSSSSSSSQATTTTLSSSLTSSGLTRDEEIQYSYQLRTFRAAVRLRDVLVKKQYNMYIHPTETEWADACGTSVSELRRVMQEGREARSMLVSANIGLVTNQAKKFYHATKQSMQSVGGVGTILTLQDLIQEGNLGLMEAAERYQPEKGFRFSTYATWWVRQRISKCVTESSRTIRLPSYVHTMLQKVNRARTMIKSETGKDPSMQDLSEYLEITVDKLQQYTKSSQNVVSLESPVRTNSFKDDSRTIGDTLASDGPTPYEDAEAEHLRRDIRTVIDASLQEVERDVIIYRYGLDNQQKPRSVAETAQQLGIPTDRVRLYEARALNKLRHPQRNNLLKEYITSSTSYSCGGVDSTSNDKSRLNGQQKFDQDSVGVNGSTSSTTRKTVVSSDVLRWKKALSSPNASTVKSTSLNTLRQPVMENRFVVFEKSDIEVLNDNDDSTSLTEINHNQKVSSSSRKLTTSEHQQPQVWLF